jgi:hypothetical protein
MESALQPLSGRGPDAKSTLCAVGMAKPPAIQGVTLAHIRAGPSPTKSWGDPSHDDRRPFRMLTLKAHNWLAPSVPAVRLSPPLRRAADLEVAPFPAAIL